MSSRIVLLGPRGAGKSSVGARLATRLSVPFVDTDRAVEEEAGRPLPALWAAGEFRAREERAVARALALPEGVVAVGGGAVLWDGFRDAVRGWKVVWLDASPAVLAARILGDPRPRPSLTGRPPEEEIGEVTRARAPLYAAVAWRHVRTDRLQVDEVASEIERLVRATGGGSAD
jgi:shikimate kinase